MADETEGCVAATAIVLCVYCLCQLDFWMGRSLDGSLTNDNLVEGDKLIDYQDYFFFLQFKLQ